MLSSFSKFQLLKTFAKDIQVSRFLYYTNYGQNKSLIYVFSNFIKISCLYFYFLLSLMSLPKVHI